MRKAFLAVFLFVPVLVLSGCVTTETSYTPQYNAGYVSATGYGVGDYGLGFGNDYKPAYNSGYGTLIMR